MSFNSASLSDNQGLCGISHCQVGACSLRLNKLHFDRKGKEAARSGQRKRKSPEEEIECAFKLENSSQTHAETNFFRQIIRSVVDLFPLLCQPNANEFSRTLECGGKATHDW